MSALFLKRFLTRPAQVASIIPSSKALVRAVAGKIDFSAPRVIAEFGPGEGCHTREILARLAPGSRLLLFELDPDLARHLEEQFHDDPRVTVLNANALELPAVMLRLGIEHCDYVVSGIPFSILEGNRKRELLNRVHDALAAADHAAFVIYQITNELRALGHCKHFPRAETEYCFWNIPPNYVTKFYRTANGNGNGNGRH